MITREINLINALRKLRDNDGLTLRKGKSVTYKSGYQVATHGVECNTPERAATWCALYEGNCGVWFSKGIYYIDKSHRVSTKREALEVGRAHSQQSVLKWSDMSLVWC